MNKGFTLIEVLAVIVIIVVIVVIAVPNVNKAINNANQQTFLQSVKGIYKTVYNDAVDSGGMLNVVYTYRNNNLVKQGTPQTTLSTKNKIKDAYGNIIIDSNGEILITITNDQYCATNEFGNEVEIIDMERCRDALEAVGYES